MPKYQYVKLIVKSREPRSFGPSQLRTAVEYLKTVAVDGSRIGIGAETHVRAGGLRLRAQPFLELSQIIGRTPREVWELFDAEVDEQRKGLIDRWLGRRPVSYDEYLD